MTEKREQLEQDWRTIDRAIARLRASVMAVVFGLLGGTGLFVATLWLVIRGPAPEATEVGPTLGLLNNYFPGYAVTWVGSLVGFFYGALTGAVVGWAVALIYNLVAGKRHDRLTD
jgi:hypothetical protein